MNKHTYNVGAKPALERVLMRFEELGRHNPEASIRPDLQNTFERLWSHDEFKRYIDEAVQRYCRIVERRGANRGCAIRLDCSEVRSMKLELLATFLPRSGEA